jgi:2-methylcitrate dehydratase PrpD
MPDGNIATTPRGDQLTDYIAGARDRKMPPEVEDATKQALADTLGVAVGAHDQNCTRSVRAVAESWQAEGKARMFLGGRTTPGLAVLVNSTMTHAMDFDDVHPAGVGHPSGPCWLSALAIAEQHGGDEATASAAFITGFEIMARLGGGWAPGVGRSLQRRGLHPTSVFGRVAACAATAVMLDLDKQQTAYALGVAATTAGGLLGSFGTDSKPFHSGKAAMDGILAAQLGQAGFVSATQLYELDKGLLDAFIQDKEVEVPPLDFDDHWEILGNAYKPYASCRATHGSVQAARTLAGKLGGRKVERIHAKTHANAVVTAGKLAPQTPLEGKFSVPFCIAMALNGYSMQAPDFSDATYNDPRVKAIYPLVELEPIQDQKPGEAHLEVFLEDGEVLRADTDIVLGNPGNPLSWDDIHNKFKGLVEPVLGEAKAAELFETARTFEKPGSIAKISELLGPVA